MAKFLIKWTVGDGNIVVIESGGDVVISSDTCHFGEDRSQVITFETNVGNYTDELLVVQKADGSLAVLIDSANAILQDNKGNILLGNV